LLSSPRCVEAVHRAVSGEPDWEGSVWQEWNKLHCFVVGEKTAALTEQKLRLSTEGSESGNAKALADYLVTKGVLEEKPLLFPCGNLASASVSILTSANIRLDQVTVYDTEPTSNLSDIVANTLREIGMPDCIVLFSPSVARFAIPVLLKCSVALSNVKIVAIGPTTAAAVSAAGFTVSLVASKPSVDALCEALYKL